MKGGRLDHLAASNLSVYTPRRSIHYDREVTCFVKSVNDRGCWVPSRAAGKGDARVDLLYSGRVLECLVVLMQFTV